MSIIKNSPKILIIDPNGHTALQQSLEQEYGMGVTRLTQGQTALETVQTTKPDLIVLNATLTNPAADALLSQLTSQKLTPPVVLIDANGDTASTDFKYPHIIGFLYFFKICGIDKKFHSSFNCLKSIHIYHAH